MSDLLALALEAHGGLERWRAIRSIDATLSVSGSLWQIKGHPEGLPDIRLHLETDRPFVTIAPSEERTAKAISSHIAFGSTAGVCYCFLELTARPARRFIWPGWRLRFLRNGKGVKPLKTNNCAKWFISHPQ
jgi:hypothetical protein